MNKNIKTWHERLPKFTRPETRVRESIDALVGEISDLRSYIAELEARPAATVVAEGVMKVLMEARDTAMHNTAAARIPECGDFGSIAQNLDWAIDEIERAAHPVAGSPAEKPFAGPGDWFSVNVLGNPMREYAPGKWENAVWPSEAVPDALDKMMAGLSAEDRAECEEARAELLAMPIERVANMVRGAAEPMPASVVAGSPVEAWVSVKDRLPREGDKVLCYRPSYGDSMCVNPYWRDYDATEVGGVTHWMPAPRIPGESTPATAEPMPASEAAKQTDQAHVMPPFAAPASQHGSLPAVLQAVKDALTLLSRNQVGRPWMRSDEAIVQAGLGVIADYVAATAEQSSTAGSAKGGITNDSTTNFAAPAAPTDAKPDVEQAMFSQWAVSEGWHHLDAEGVISGEIDNMPKLSAAWIAWQARAAVPPAAQSVRDADFKPLIDALIKHSFEHNEDGSIKARTKLESAIRALIQSPQPGKEA